MTLNLFSRALRPFCQPSEHSWIVQQFRGTAGYRNLRICERCGRTHVLLPVDDALQRTPVHAAVAA